MGISVVVMFILLLDEVVDDYGYEWFTHWGCDWIRNMWNVPSYVMNSCLSLDI